MDGGKAMVSRNIVLSKILPMKGRQYLYRQIKSGPIMYNINGKAEVLIILLIFAVTFLLQDDFFLVVTPRA
jgi:hypothetical protein